MESRKMIDQRKKIHGYCDPAFTAVRDEFERNFTERGDVGASVCLYVECEEVVNLWGGMADSEKSTPWQEETITIIASASKAAYSLSAHILAERGELDFDAPVANYWPEFATNGKESVTVRMLLNHQAGLSAVQKPLPEGAFFDWDYMVNVLADEAPFWEPGTNYGYHGFTFYYLVGEVVRRVSGKSLGQFVREEVADPLALDLWIGVPESEQARIAPLLADPENPLLRAVSANSDPTSLLQLAFGNDGGYLSGGTERTTDEYAAETAAITNGRSLARLYAPLAQGGSFNGVHLVSPETIQRMGAVQSALRTEATIGAPFRFTLGFLKSPSNIGLPESAFGHGGAGGSMGFADPCERLAFGYVMNQMSTTPRWEALAKAAYQALGYREGKFGMWIK